jgi:Transposase DDE domain/SWIM zinc finger
MALSEREQRGLAIAALCKLDKHDGAWVVPSQSGNGTYKVVHDGTNPRCTCQDFEVRGGKCKHIFAVEYTIQRDVHPDGSETLTRTMTVVEKVTYQQDWPAYNLAQATEKKRLQVLLHELCRHLPEPDHLHRTGRKPHLVKDAIFTMVFKVYCGFSARRFACDLLDAHQAGYLSRPIPSMKVTAFMDNPAFTPILHDLIVQNAVPLSVVETAFAVDSSGFSSRRFERWFDHKYGTTRQQCVWVKAHIACGVKTNVITAVRILDKDAGGMGFLAFKSNATGGVGGLFEKMFHFFQFQREEFLAHYHQRSNVESTFSAVKRKFGDSVRSKTDTAMVNEVLCKLLCHNLCCLIQEHTMLGIEPIFWKNEDAGAGS